MPNTKVVDLSKEAKIPENLRHARNAGVIGMIHQATVGDTVDDKAEARVFLAKDAGMMVGLYHVLSPDLTVREQIERFVSAAEGLGLDENWLLAVQYADGDIPANALVDFLEGLEKKTKRSPVVYVSAELAAKLESSKRKLAKYRLWLSQEETVAEVPLAFGKYFLWQYTKEGTVEGITGEVGCSDTLLEDAALAKAWSGFEGRHDTELPDAAPVEEDNSQEPTMTESGELDNAEATPPEKTESGEIDQSHPPITEAGQPGVPPYPPTGEIDNELPEAPSTPDNALPEAPTTPDNTLPAAGLGPSNELPGDQPEIENDVRDGVNTPDNSLPDGGASVKKSTPTAAYEVPSTRTGSGSLEESSEEILVSSEESLEASSEDLDETFPDMYDPKAGQESVFDDPRLEKPETAHDSPFAVNAEMEDDGSGSFEDAESRFGHRNYISKLAHNDKSAAIERNKERNADPDVIASRKKAEERERKIREEAQRERKQALQEQEAAHEDPEKQKAVVDMAKKEADEKAKNKDSKDKAKDSKNKDDKDSKDKDKDKGKDKK